MVYGILGLINFAHGEVVMVGAMVALTMLQTLLAAAVAPVLAMLFSLIVAIVACMALVIQLKELLTAHCAMRRDWPVNYRNRRFHRVAESGDDDLGREYHAFPLPFTNSLHALGGAIITDVQLGIVLVALLMMAGLMLLINHSRFGRAMRAVRKILPLPP